MGTWAMNLVTSTSYAGIVFLMFIENVFPPIPSELIMPLAGYIAAQGKISLAWVIAAGTAGSVLGALPLYYLGRKLGQERLKALADRHGRWLTVSRRDLERGARWFERFGGAAVFLCRLVPGVRSLISIPAGMARMSLWRFLVYTTAGTALWAGLLAYVGYFLGRNFAAVSEWLDPIAWLVFGMLLAGYVMRVVRHKGAARPKAAS
jgi:membrane protein DedA with SNARE-associated domain